MFPADKTSKRGCSPAASASAASASTAADHADGRPRSRSSRAVTAMPNTRGLPGLAISGQATASTVANPWCRESPSPPGPGNSFTDSRRCSSTTGSFPSTSAVRSPARATPAICVPWPYTSSVPQAGSTLCRSAGSRAGLKNRCPRLTPVSRRHTRGVSPVSAGNCVRASRSSSHCCCSSRPQGVEELGGLLRAAKLRDAVERQHGVLHLLQ